MYPYENTNIYTNYTDVSEGLGMYHRTDLKRNLG